MLPRVNITRKMMGSKCLIRGLAIECKKPLKFLKTLFNLNFFSCSYYKQKENIDIKEDLMKVISEFLCKPLS